MTLRAWAVPAVVGLVVLSASAANCPGRNGTVRCRSDLECGAFRRCDAATGVCQCTDSRACGDGEFCNTAQLCQALAGCSDNTDCEALGGATGLICDVKTSSCQAAGSCYQDPHCPLGNVCELSTASCRPGCRDEGDCPLGSGCLRDTPNAPLGTCRAGSCSTDGQCKAGELCDLTTARCLRDVRGPFCGACQRFDPTDPQCGDPANYCLIDTGDPARRSHYCGVDCSQQQGCPQGYQCKDVIIVGPPATPSCNVEDCVNNTCTTTGAPCQMPVDCPQGPPGGDCPRAHDGICLGTVGTTCMVDGDCGGSPGSCQKAECRVREMAAYGFCSCVIDSDCPTDDCRNADLTDPQNPVAGHCYLSGHRCYDEPDCNVIACVEGGCRIGSNCKPGMDRRCADLQLSTVSP